MGLRCTGLCHEGKYTNGNCMVLGSGGMLLRGPFESAVTHFIRESDERNGRRLLRAWGECGKWPRPIGDNGKHLLGVSEIFRHNMTYALKSSRL